MFLHVLGARLSLQKVPAGSGFGVFLKILGNFKLL